MRAGISIVICTYNGAKRLPQTLRHIALQRVSSDVPWELIIVDNASTDNSAQIATIVWNEHTCRIPFSIVHQPVPGLSFAREMGFSKSQFNYILMCDDDNWLHEDYIETAFEVMEQNPRCAVLGGNGTFVYESTPPAWLKSYSLYAGGPQAPATGQATHNRLYGAGSILRKSAYYAIYKAGFRSLLADRMAAQLTSGGDHELCFGLALAGYEILYDERLKFKHFITNNRLSWQYYQRYIKESAKCFEVLEPYKILLETNKTSTTSFYVRLTRSFLYHIKKFIPLWWEYQKADKKSEHGKVTEIQCIILKTRIRSYFNGFNAMRKNFKHVVQLQNKLDKKTVISREREELICI